MNGIDPYAYMQTVSMQLDSLSGRQEIEVVIDDIEYLFEVIPAEFQDQAEQLISLLRDKLSNVTNFEQ